MTFEEFITKKKIDLAQFKIAEPGLFLEFQSHYSQMGEKSFDHSKKFWFNKLRRAYHLKEEPKPVVAKEVVEINEIASQAEPLLSPTLEATVYTPRFKARPTPTPAPTELAKTSEIETGNSDKPAYKPRFKAPAGTAEKPETETTTPPLEQSKPAFKPRFKPGITSTQEPIPAEARKEENTTQSSDLDPQNPPAYKPRFKPSMAKPKKEE